MIVSHRSGNKESPTVTIFLLTAILLVWLISTLAGGREQVSNALTEGPSMPVALALGAMGPGLVLGHGEYWRLISACFLHFGLIHLAFNSWALVVFGPQLEKEFGKGRFLFLYVASG